MRYIKRLPKNARYDYTDIFGRKHFHSVSRNYIVCRDSVISEAMNDD